MPDDDSWNVTTSSPCSHSNSDAFADARLRNAEPWALRHIEQWQLSARFNTPLIRYVTRPHRQLPRIMLPSAHADDGLHPALIVVAGGRRHFARLLRFYRVCRSVTCCVTARRVTVSHPGGLVSSGKSGRCLRPSRLTMRGGSR